MIARVATAASLVLKHAGAYGDLIADDFGSAWQVPGRRIRVGVVLVVAVLISAEMACVWAIAVTWDTPYRPLAIGGLLESFVLVAGGVGVALSAMRGRRPDVFAQTGWEWQKDRLLFDGLPYRVRMEKPDAK